MAVLNKSPQLEVSPDTTLRDIVGTVGSLANTITQVGSFVNQIKNQDDQRQYRMHQQIIKENAIDKGLDPALAMFKDKRVYDSMTALKRYDAWGHFNKDTFDAGPNPLDTRLIPTDKFIETFVDTSKFNESQQLLFKDYVTRIKSTVGETLDTAEQDVLRTAIERFNDPNFRETAGALAAEGQIKVIEPGGQLQQPNVTSTEGTGGTTESSVVNPEKVYDREYDSGVGDYYMGKADSNPVTYYTPTRTVKTEQPIQAVQAHQAIEQLKLDPKKGKEFFASVGTVHPNYAKYKDTAGYAIATQNAYKAIPDALESQFGINFTDKEKVLIANQYNNPEVLKVVNGLLNTNMDMKQWTSFREGFAHTLAVEAMDRGNPNSVIPTSPLIYFPSSAVPTVAPQTAKVETPKITADKVTVVDKKPEEPVEYTTALGVGSDTLLEAQKYMAEEPQRKYGEDTNTFQARYNAWEEGKKARNLTLNNMRLEKKQTMGIADDAQVMFNGSKYTGKQIKEFINTDPKKAEKLLDRWGNAAQGKGVSMADLLTDPSLTSIPEIKRYASNMQQAWLSQNKQIEPILKEVLDMKDRLMKNNIDVAKLEQEDRKMMVEQSAALAKLKFSMGESKELREATKTYNGFLTDYNNSLESYLKTTGFYKANDDINNPQYKEKYKKAVSEYNKTGGKVLISAMDRVKADVKGAWGVDLGVVLDPYYEDKILANQMYANIQANLGFAQTAGKVVETKAKTEKPTVGMSKDAAGFVDSFYGGN